MKHTIAYHDYIALLCSLDDSTSIRLGRDADQEVRSQFNSICKEYKGRVTDKCGEWASSNKIPDESRAHFATYLYNPLSFLTFGHADSLGIVLIDDVDAMLEMTADIRSPIEQVQLAFCPTLESLGINDNPYLCDPHNLFLQHVDGSFRLETHSPLMLSTKLKVNGLALMHDGLLIQAALYRAISQCITTVTTTLRASYLEPTCERTNALMTVADISPESLRICILDPQGSEEISLLVFCSNYTVGVHIVAAIRTLTLYDLCVACPGLESHLANSQVYKTLCGTVFDDGDDDGIKTIGDNHVLSKTYTTLGVSYPCLQRPASFPCNGFIIGAPHFDVNPGHMSAIQSKLRGLFVGSGALAHSNPPVIIGTEESLHRFLVGRHDSLFELQRDGRNSSILAIPTTNFLDGMRHLYLALGCTNKLGSDETGLLDVSTSVVVPFPRFENREVEDRLIRPLGAAHKPFMRVLNTLVETVFGVTRAANDLASTENSSVLVDADVLLPRQLRKLLIPSSLRRTIRYLYQEYSRCLADPFLFEVAVDLFDCFYTLHRVISCQVATMTSQDGIALSGHRGVLRADDFEQLNLFVVALHNSLTHRVAMSQAQWEARDMAIDFRGGLNRIVASAEVPLRHGIDLFRQLLPVTASPNEPSAGSDSYPLHPAAAVTQITFSPSPTVSVVELRGLQRMCLAHIEMDVAHILNPTDYAMFVHEVSHLIVRNNEEWSGWTNRTVATIVGDGDAQSIRRVATTLEEMAVEVLTYLLVFCPDRSVYGRYMCSKFNSHIGNAGIGVTKAVARFIEVLLRAFSATVAIDEGEDVADLLASDLNGRVSRWSVNQLEERFAAYSTELAPFFLESHLITTNRLSQHEFGDLCRSAFREYWADYGRAVGDVWGIILRIFVSGGERGVLRDWLRPAGEKAAIRERVDCAIRSGGAYVSHKVKSDSPAFSNDASEFFISCALINSVVQSGFSQIDTDLEIHAPRSGDDRRIDLARAAPAQFSRVLLDPLRSGWFCVEPASRRKLIQTQIAVLKSLWNQSTNQRGIRFCQLLRLAFG